MIQQELTYWYAYDGIPGTVINRERKIGIYSEYYRTHNSDELMANGVRASLIDFYEDTEYQAGHLTEIEVQALNESKAVMANASFIVEDLLAQGYDMIPIDSGLYPKTLKKNLGHNSPLLLYVKGNKDLLAQPSTAIVGCRSASQTSLDFTRNIAKKSVFEGKTVISGDARGVDQTGQIAALENGGSCIIVLPQGIATFSSGFRKYYEYIVQGKLLVLSTFPPKATWNAGYAMERNKYIYGLASEIYVAESDSKGGTWEGVQDGLKKNREINVRYPDKTEKNANLKLIDMGACAVDIDGIRINPPTAKKRCAMQLSLF